MAKRPDRDELDKREGTVEDERTKEELRRENYSLKVQMALLKRTLEAEIRRKNGSQPVRNASDERALIDANQFKDSVISDLESKIRHLQKELKDTKDQLKRSTERERKENSKVEKLKKKCGELVKQIDDLTSQQQESDAEISLLKEKIVRLEDEIDELSITSAVFSLD